MNLQQLYYFREICNQGSYTKAAETLHVAQSSISHAIHELETELGVPLFVKRARATNMSEYGEKYFLHVQKIIEELEIANREIQELNNPDSGCIRIAFGQTIGNRFLPNLIQKYYHHIGSKKIKFELSEKTADNVRECLLQHSIDLGFSAFLKTAEKDLEYFHILDEEMVAVVPNQHYLASRTHVSLKELLKYPLVTYSRRCGTRYWLDVVFERQSLHPEIIQEVESEKVMTAAVASGCGVGIMPRIRELSLYDVTALTIDNSEIHRSMYMCWLKEGPIKQRHIVKQFRDFLITQIQQMKNQSEQF